MKYVLEITAQDCGKVFAEYGQVTTDDSLLFNFPEKVVLVVFTGGHDVWPELYGENARCGTSYSIQRDMYEGEMFEQARKYNIPCVGICRGAQFLCVKSGGKLVQDIGGHGGAYHKIRTIDNRLILVNSSHHQMQLPPKDAKVLAWSDKRLSNRYLNGDGDNLDVDREYEIVYYPNINSLGIQSHPEWEGPTEESALYAQEVVREYLFNTPYSVEYVNQGEFDGSN